MAQNSFSLSFNDFADKSIEQVKLIQKKTLIDLSDSIVKDSPVDTGRFRANWFGSWDDVEADTTESIDKSGEANVSKIKSNVNEKFGEVFYLVNNIPYGEWLEYGIRKNKLNELVFMKKQPYAMVRKNIIRFNYFLKNNIKVKP